MNGGEEKVKGQPGVLFFDAAGTLIRLAQPVGRTYAQVARDHGLETDEALMEKAFRSIWANTPHRQPSAVARPGDDRPWWSDLAESVLRQTTFPPADFDFGAWFSDLYDRFSLPGAWLLYDDVLPCLDLVRRHARLAVVSNFDGRLRAILGGLGIGDHFEELFISSEIGAEKPSPEIFQRAVKVMGVAPSECLHIGDDAERDAAGAWAAGLCAFIVNRPERGLEEVTKLYV